MCRNKKGAQHEYFQILERRRVAAQRVFVENQLGRPIASLEGIPIIEGAAYLTNVSLDTNSHTASAPMLYRVSGESCLGDYHYEPTVFLATRTIGKEARLELGFLGYVLERLQGRRPDHGQ